MDDKERRQESDLGQEQRRRVQEETPGLGDSTAEPAQPLDRDLREDLRRAQPNPPVTEPAKVDPMSDVDLGYMEDQERETDWDLDSLERPVAAEPTDPLEAEREERARPGRSTGQLPDEVGNRPPGERDRR